MAAVPQYIADLQVGIARLEGKVDTFLEQMKKQDDRTTTQEVRIRKVENRQHWYAGAAAGIGALVTAFVEAAFGHH